MSKPPELLASHHQGECQEEQAGDWDLPTLISHELKTPISTLLLIVQTLQKTALPEQKKWLNMMEEELGSMAQLISDTLDLTGAKIGLHKGQQDWGQWIQSACGVFKKALLFSKVRLKIHPLGGGDIRVLIDPIYMRQALLNLVVNAGEHALEDSSIDISWSVQQDHHQLEVLVTNKGQGIAEEDIKKIFKPFYKGRGRGHRVLKKSGLGLNVAKAIIEAHGGHISAQNNPHSPGVNFIFTLPIV